MKKETTQSNDGQKIERPKVERDKLGRLKKGSINNPKGKPIGTKSFTTLVREALNTIANLNGGNPEGLTYETMLVNRVLKKAIEEGDREMIKQIWDQIDGRPAQKLDVTTKGERIEGFTYVQPTQE